MGNQLERLIRQTQPFKSEYIKAELGILYLSSYLHNQQQQYFKKYNISPQQYNVLRILRGQYPRGININAIKERMLDKMSDVSRIVDRLSKMNLVVKMLNLIDKRNADITISEMGLSILKEIDEDAANMKTLINELQSTEVETLNAILDKLMTSL